MVNKVLNGISLKLKEKYDYPIYGDEIVSQGMERPCFFISITQANKVCLPSGRSKLTVPVDVIYFPQKTGSYTEMRERAEQLFEVVEVIDLEDGTSTRGRGLRYEIEDGILHFFVSFVLHLIDQKDEEDFGSTVMEDMQFYADMK